MSMRGPQCPPGFSQSDRGGLLVNNGFGERVIAPTFASIALSATGDAVRVKMPPGRGFIVGMLGCSRGDGTPAGMSSLAVQIKIGSDSKTLVTDGNDAAGFAVFATLFGLDGHRMFPLMREVTREEEWEFTCKNFHAANAYVPSLSLLYRAAN